MFLTESVPYSDVSYLERILHTKEISSTHHVNQMLNWRDMLYQFRSRKAGIWALRYEQKPLGDAVSDSTTYVNKRVTIASSPHTMTANCCLRHLWPRSYLKGSEHPRSSLVTLKATLRTWLHHPKCHIANAENRFDMFTMPYRQRLLPDIKLVQNFDNSTKILEQWKTWWRTSNDRYCKQGGDSILANSLSPLDITGLFA